MDITNPQTNQMSDLYDEANIENEKITNEEYKIWKKNCPYLYDLVISRALDWPTLTCQWFPDFEQDNSKDYTIHRMLIGTHTSDKEQNYLQIVNVTLPNQPKEEELQENKNYQFDEDENDNYGKIESKFQIIQKINHTSEINRARYMPQNPDLIATRVTNGDIYIFDRKMHPLKPTNDKCEPQITLRKHTGEGYPLEWSKLKEGQLLTGSEDNLVCLWDITKFSKERDIMEPLTVYKGHSSVVNDVSWCQHNHNVFASVGDDHKLIIWDARNGEKTLEINAHESEINSVSFNNSMEHILLTGGIDSTIKLWDKRNLSKYLHNFEGHNDQIVQLEWNPNIPTIFSSASADRRVNIWDISLIGEDQTEEDAMDGPPELLFIHGGHTNKLSDISWNPNMPWMLASTADDNVCQIWEMSSHVYASENDKIRESEKLEM